VSEGHVYTQNIRECRRIFTVLIRRSNFKYVWCHPGSLCYNFSTVHTEPKRRKKNTDEIMWTPETKSRLKMAEKSKYEDRAACVVYYHPQFCWETLSLFILGEETVNFTMMYGLQYFLKQGRQYTYNVH
jgi:hypothetical protein